MVYYPSGKFNVDADALSRIPWVRISRQKMTMMDWVQAQKVVTWIESKKLDTVKMGEEMSPELK